MRIAFSTLGCKINQFETDEMRRDLEGRGTTIVPFNADADVYIINTCSVTAKSDSQSRQIIRSAIRRGGKARVVVTGCYAETRPDEIWDIAGVDLVCGNRDKAALVERIMTTQTNPASRTSRKVREPAGSVHRRTRGFMKIQDGCDNRCSYCIVPSSRGPSRSVAPQMVRQEFRRLVEAGCPEVVLSGIHIGTYGSDFGSGITLTGLVRTLLDERNQSRIRLSSIEPTEITDELIGFLGTGLCRHLHIPLQSGDDSILASMKRTYTSRFYQNLLERIANEVPGTALGADVMVGFPGEGEAEFQNTFSLIRNSPLTHLHVFSYSPRPGTPAAAMKNQVPDPVKKERSEALLSLGKEKNLDFRSRFVGTELQVVVEDNADIKTGVNSGISDNYIRVYLSDYGQEYSGKQINVVPKSVREGGLLC